MNSIQVQLKIILVVCGMASSMLCGCQVSRTTVQMDSDTRSPRLGVQLRPKDREPHGENVAEGIAEETQTAAIGVSHEEPMTAKSRFSKLLGRFGKPKRIPLPRTDLDPEVESEESNESKSDDFDGFE